MKTLRSFLLALAAIAVVLTSAKPAEADTIAPCEIRTVWIAAGDRGIIRLPEVVKSDPGQYVFVVEVFTTDDDPSILRSHFWYVCQPGFRLNPGWEAQIEMHAPGLIGFGVRGTHIILSALPEVGQGSSVLLRGGVFWCGTIEDCLKKAIAGHPEAFVQPAPPRP